MSIRRSSDKKPSNAPVAWQALISHPTNALLVHVERGFGKMSVAPISMPKRSAAEGNGSGSDTEDDSDPIVQARREGKKKQKEFEEGMRKSGFENQKEKNRIINKYVEEGRSSITPAEKQWYESFEGVNLDRKVSKFVLQNYVNQSWAIMQRLPPGNKAGTMDTSLKKWQMAKIGQVILETAAQMCDAIVAEFSNQGMDPIRDAQTHTASMKLNINLDFKSVLPPGTFIPAPSIPSASVEVFARTTPSKARSQMNARYRVDDLRAAITWSVKFLSANPEDQQNIRDAVNLGLNGPGNRADSKSDGVQISIETVGGLNAALNELWTRVLEYPYESYAYAWTFAVPPMIPVTFGPAQMRNTAPAPPAPAPGPAPGPGGWMLKKRKQPVPPPRGGSGGGGGSGGAGSSRGAGSSSGM